MEREEMLKRLKNLKGYKIAGLTMTYDLGLQIRYATAEGEGSNFGNIGEWPLIKLDNKGLALSWEDFCKNINDNSLTHEMISGSTINRFVKYAEDHYGTFEDGFSLDDDDEDDPIYDEEFISQFNEDIKNLPVFLKPLAQLSAKESDEFYLLFDCKSWSLDEIQVFKDEISAWNALREYVGDDIYCTWEEMDDDELSSWYEDLQDVLDESEYDSIISIKFLEMKNED